MLALVLPMTVAAQQTQYIAISSSIGVYDSVDKPYLWQPQKMISIPVTVDLDNKTLCIFSDTTQTFDLLSFEKTGESEHFRHWKIGATNQNGIKVIIHEQMPINSSFEHLIMIWFPDYSILYEISPVEAASSH
jgi:hypothetical protein